MIKVGVIFGGESVEHEVSIISAVQAMKENLTKLVNGLEAMGYASEAYDLARPATTKKEPGRETYRGEDR